MLAGAAGTHNYLASPAIFCQKAPNLSAPTQWITTTLLLFIAATLLWLAVIPFLSLPPTTIEDIFFPELQHQQNFSALNVSGIKINV